MKRLHRVVAWALGAVLACGVAPALALAQGEEPAQQATVQLEPGTYAEHEAIAYVMGAQEDIALQSAEDDILAGAQCLMTVDPAVVDEAVDGGNDAYDGAIRLQSAAAGGESGTLVLVRDESRTTEELIAALEADSRVAFAEPNYTWEGPDDTAGASDGASSTAAESPAAQLSDQPAPDLTAYQWANDNSGIMTDSLGDNAVDIEYDAWEAAAESGDWRAAAEQARSQMASSEPVVVAVVDTGVDASNPDLAPVMWDDGLSIPELVELGGTILSTYHTAKPSYMGEVDDDAVLYESFDVQTHASADSGLASGSPQLTFTYEGTGEACEIVEDGMCFEGDAALAVEFDADADTSGSAIAGIELIAGYQMIVSDPIDLSGVVEKPTRLSVRYATSGASDEGDLWLCLKMEGSDELMLIGSLENSFRAVHSSWGGEDEPDEPEDPSEGEAEDGKPGDTGDAAGPGNSEDPGKPGSSDGHLAQTGDASMTYVIVLGALGCISLAAGRALCALRATRSSK